MAKNTQTSALNFNPLTNLTKETTGKAPLKVLVAVAVLMCLFLAWIRLQQGYGSVDAILSAVTLAVAALPEEFPVVFTVFLGIGVYRLAKRQALVRRAVVVENIGRTSRTGSDKTGTITEGQIRLAHDYPAAGLSAEALLMLAALASRRESGDPLDTALLEAAPTSPGTIKRVATFPFTEDRKRETAIVQVHPRTLLVAVKGAPEVVLGLSALSAKEQTAWQERATRLAATGHKVIACAWRELDKATWSGDEPRQGLTFAGLFACEAPVREGAPGKPVPKAVGNILSNWVAFVFTSGVAFFLSPYIVAKLGNTAYGIWTLLTALTGYLGLLDLGVRSAVTRYVARFHTQGDHVESGRVVSSALVIFGASGLLAVSISLGLAVFVPRLFQIPETYAPIAQLVLLIAGLNVAVSLVTGVFGAIVTGLQRFDLSNLIEMLSTTCRTVWIVAALDTGRGLLALALIHLSFSLGNLCAYLLLSRRLYPELRARLADCDRPHLKLIFSFSAYSFLLQISGFLIFYTDSVIIGAFLPVSAVTFYAIAGNLMNYTRSVLSGITTVIAPLASSLETASGVLAVRQTLLRGGRYATMVIAPIVLTFMLRGESFINLWMGPSYGELSGRVLWVLALAMLFAAGNYTASATMIGTGRHKGIVPLALGEALTNLALSIVLVQSWGVVGVAWGTTLPDLAASFLFWPWYVQRTLSIPVREYLASIWLRPFLALLPFALATYALETFWPAGNLLVFFLQVGALVPLALVTYWHVCVAPGERLALAARLPKLRRPAAMGMKQRGT